MRVCEQQIALEMPLEGGNNAEGFSEHAVDELSEMNVAFSFVIPRDTFSSRALLFDSVIGRGTPNSSLHSTPDLWRDLDTLKDQKGLCFVIPCTASGVLIEGAEFAFREK